MDRLQQLHDAGVSIWLDTLSRELLETGATSNPTIFAKAITGSDRYDEQLQAAGHARSAAALRGDRHLLRLPRRLGRLVRLGLLLRRALRLERGNSGGASGTSARCSFVATASISPRMPCPRSALTQPKSPRPPLGGLHLGDLHEHRGEEAPSGCSSTARRAHSTLGSPATWSGSSAAGRQSSPLRRASWGPNSPAASHRQTRGRAPSLRAHAGWSASCVGPRAAASG